MEESIFSVGSCADLLSPCLTLSLVRILVNKLEDPEPLFFFTGNFAYLLVVELILKLIYQRLLFFFFFFCHALSVEVPRPGIQPTTKAAAVIMPNPLPTAPQEKSLSETVLIKLISKFLDKNFYCKSQDELQTAIIKFPKWGGVIVLEGE